MAEPRRAATSAPRIEGGRFLVVEARYYDTIGADLLMGATGALAAAGATHDLVSVAGALEIPVGMAIALDAAKAGGARMTARLRLAASFAARRFTLRSWRANRPAR